MKNQVREREQREETHDIKRKKKRRTENFDQLTFKVHVIIR